MSVEPAIDTVVGATTTLETDTLIYLPSIFKPIFPYHSNTNAYTNTHANADPAANAHADTASHS